MRNSAKTKMILYASTPVVELLAVAERAEQAGNVVRRRQLTIEYFKAMRREIFPSESNEVTDKAIFAILWPGSTKEAIKRRVEEEAKN
jgi:hypothetical protein